MNIFKNKAQSCKHEHLSNYHKTGKCATDFCWWEEHHCIECGAYVTTCGCGFNNGIDGWPSKRRNKERQYNTHKMWNNLNIK